MSSVDRRVLIPLANGIFDHPVLGMGLTFAGILGGAVTVATATNLWAWTQEPWLYIGPAVFTVWIISIGLLRIRYTAHGVAGRGNLDALKAIGEAGYDLNQLRFGMTPLQTAILHGHRGVIEYLVGQSGCQPSGSDPASGTANPLSGLLKEGKSSHDCRCRRANR